jgi:hypothetical protein
VSTDDSTAAARALAYACHGWPVFPCTDSAQRITAENTTLHHRIRQLTDERCILRERLDAACSTSRFLDRRFADLEAQIAEHIIQAT